MVNGDDRRGATARNFALLWLSSFALSCLDVADDRAEIDARVGSSTRDGHRVQVEDGRAAVRALSDGDLRLWASAPSLSAELRTADTDAQTWRVTLENLLPDAAVLVTVDGTDIAPLSESQPLPTRRVLELQLPPDATVRLRVAAPDDAEVGPFRYAVFADVQDAIDDVQDIYRRMNEDPSIRFVVMSGDLTEQGEREQLERFQRELQQLRVPLYATLGNHELGAGEGNYHRYFGRGSHHFVFRGAHFTLIDDASATIAPRVYDWLDGWLRDGRDAFHSVYMHLPPLDAEGVRNGAFASRAEANLLLGTLARANVDLTVYGHVHSYYAYQNAGIPAFITGGGGAIPEKLDRIGRHFLVVDVDPDSQRFDTAIIHVD